MILPARHPRQRNFGTKLVENRQQFLALMVLAHFSITLSGAAASKSLTSTLLFMLPHMNACNWYAENM